MCSYDNTKDIYEKLVSDAKAEDHGKKGAKKGESSKASNKGKGKAGC